MQTLIIDNYDSFTFNLFQLVAEVNRVPPRVVKNDEMTWAELQALDFDNIVISPGPGRPENTADFGVCAELIREADVPILGVCLGHQGICHEFGGTVDYAQAVMHGRISDIHHSQVGPFEGIPTPFSAVRYHSLVVTTVPPELEPIAWTSDRLLMAVRHRDRPIWGVQFHPESVCTEYGRHMMRNFRKQTNQFLKRRPMRASRSPLAQAGPSEAATAADSSDSEASIHGLPFTIHSRRLAIRVDPEQVFENLISDSTPAFWLDGELVGDSARFSYMGDLSGPFAEFISYDVDATRVTVDHRGAVSHFDEDIFSYLKRMLGERQSQVSSLPFDFALGYVGYLGYEVKADCGAARAHSAPTSDASFVFADRMIAFDHEEGMVYLVCLETPGRETRASAWFERMTAGLQSLRPKTAPFKRSVPLSLQPRFRHSAEEYLELIGKARAEIKKGETYEVCLTNEITYDVEIDPLNTYRLLRARSSAPYATYLRFPGVSVVSSSPERFLTVDANGIVESKPIKGTRRRGNTQEEDEQLISSLQESEKDRSENLMIVDLLRNDIGSVSDVGSVHVPDLFAVESYATVHQLVSTVRGRLRRDVTAVDCVRAAFPGGSMTGAPKLRTMEIIDRLEAGPRGIYSGSIGFFGLNGSADLSITIRTIVATDSDVTVGVGGAIVDLSTPADELEEMFLKAEALGRVLAETALQDDSIQAECPG